MKSPIRSHRLHHGITNLLLNILYGFILFPVVFYCGTEGFKTVANYLLVRSFKDGSPFTPIGYYWHAGDKMDVAINRWAGFTASVESARLLRRVVPGSNVEDVVDRQMLPMSSIEEGPKQIIVHPILPDNIPPGRYHYIFPGRYTLFDRTNSFVWRTKDFEVMAKDVPIDENTKSRLSP